MKPEKPITRFAYQHIDYQARLVSNSIWTDKHRRR